jgi:hypothetical protein
MKSPASPPKKRSDWVRFATTGNPGWTPDDPDAQPTRVYTANPTIEPYPEDRSRFIWSNHRFDALDLPTCTIDTTHQRGRSGTWNPRWRSQITLGE